MSKQICIGCKRKFSNEAPTLLCDDCYEKYKANLQQEKQPGRCPVCGGSVQYSPFYEKLFFAGTMACSDKCKRIARIVKHRMQKEAEQHDRNM